MSTNDEQLPLWYQSSKLREDFVIGRPSSLRIQRISLQDGFEYQLFPIYEKDADMLLFNTVWDIVMHPDFYDFYNDSNIINDKIYFNDDIVWHRPYLLFPSDAPCMEYVDKERNHPYIVGVFSEYLDTEYPIMGFDDEDEYPMFRAYLIPEWNVQQGELDVVYRMHQRDREERMPMMTDNTQELINVLGDLVRYIKSINIDTMGWIDRLETSLTMLKIDTNELFILHNAGLYDINSLWKLLENSGGYGEEIYNLCRKVESELHRFAMMIVNLVDWKKGGIDNTKILKSSKYNEEIKGFLPDNWWNDIGVMEKAFKWTDSEKKMLDDAYKEGTCGRGAFSDNLDNYANVLRYLVKQHLWEMSKSEQDAQRREWLLRNCR